ncbi:MAG: PASTA domain-containing protein [Gemmatimonadota bacterium]|nr:PASTA domain-containing protein [Gemmatimonadota bacterium]
MKITGRVFSSDGTLMKEASVIAVVASGESIGQGSVRNGQLVVDANDAMIWGLLINELPIVTIPVKVVDAASKAAEIDVGDITYMANGISGNVFHAKNGRVFGVPSFLYKQVTSEETPPVVDTPTNTNTVSLVKGLTVSNLLGSTAQQIGQVSTAVSGLTLKAATVQLKGVPTVSETAAVGLDFPNAQLAASGAGLSQLTFVLGPMTAGVATPDTTGVRMPDVTGYTRDLAGRKLATLDNAVEFSQEIISSEAEHGRVVRTIPAPRATLSPDTVVRVYLGKYERS